MITFNAGNYGTYLIGDGQVVTGQVSVGRSIALQGLGEGSAWGAGSAWAASLEGEPYVILAGGNALACCLWSLTWPPVFADRMETP